MKLQTEQCISKALAHSCHTPVAVPVAIHIPTPRPCVQSDVHTIERIGSPRLLCKGWAGGSACVEVVLECAILYPNDAADMAEVSKR